MIIDLANLEGSSQPFKFTVTAEELDLDVENFRLRSAVSASGQATKQIVQTDVNGTIIADAEIDCTRCLSPVENDLAIDFDVSYVMAGEFADEGDGELDEADLGADLLSGDSIDLNEIVREQILLNLPTQIFCSQDCKGLCQKCGANLNLIDCNCKDEEIDPRWAALKNLK